MLFLACALTIRAHAQELTSAPRSEDPIKSLMLVDVAAREAAERQILAEGPAAIPRLLAFARGDRSRRTVQRLAVKMGRPAIPALIAQLGDANVAQRAGSILYSVIGPDSADQIPALIDCAGTKPEVRNYCGTALLKIMSPKAAAQVPALRQALTSPAPEARMFAAGALAKAGPAGRVAAPEIAALLKDGSPQVRLGATIALGQLGGKSAVVRKALQDLAGRSGETVEIRQEARKAMRRWNA